MIRPWLLEETPPPDPTEDVYDSTLGSRPMMAATSFWWADIDSNDVPSAVSVLAMMRPVSSLGMNPLGTVRKSSQVPTKITREKASATRRWSMTHPSERAYAARERW